MPVEQGWDREEFLRGLCHKAWLPSNAWKDKDAQLYGFEAEVWGKKNDVERGAKCEASRVTVRFARQFTP